MGKVGALWKNKDKNDDTYLSGSIEVYGKIKVFKNNRKTEEKHPDYVIFDTRIEETGKKDDEGTDDMPF